MTLEELHGRIMQIALAYPEAYEENPWGERVVKVRNKIFLFSSVYKGRLHFTVKVPQSGAALLTRPCASPTGYGLGKSGWVTMHFDRAEEVPIDEVPALIDESYRTLAPKRLVKNLDAPASEAPARARARGRLVIIGDDSKRLERARTALTVAGFEIVAQGEADPQTLAAIADLKPHAVIVDLGRLAPHALEFARYLVDDLGGSIGLAFAGARDAATEKKAAALGAILTTRQPPGDAAFVEALIVKGGFARPD